MKDVPDLITDNEHGDWLHVPEAVAVLVHHLAPCAFKVAAASVDDDALYWDVERDRPCAAPGADTVLIKQAGADFLRPVTDTVRAGLAPLGGARPLTLALAGGVLGSGLGYGGGWLAEKLLGERLAPPGSLRRRGMIAGGLLGAAPGAVLGGIAYANPQATGRFSHDALEQWPFETGAQARKPSLIGALLSRWPFEPSKNEPPGGHPALNAPSPVPVPPTGVPAVPWAGRTNPELWAQESRFDGRVFTDPRVKVAELDTGLFYMPTIPVDAFNGVVWSNVHPNPYGTRDAYGTAEQPLTTPPAAAAAVSGLLAGTRAATGQPYVSPYHVALTAAVAGGKGYLTGMLAGKVLGALAGLPPAAQDELKRLGLWGGIISGVADSIFGDNG